MYSIYYQNNYYTSQMKVLSVTGTQVTVNFTDYPASNVYSGNMWFDVFSGNTNSTSNVLFAVSSGLKTGDPVFNGNSTSIQSEQPYNCGDSTSLWSSSSSDANGFATATEISAALGLPLVVIVLFVYFRRKRSKARSRKK